MERNSYVTGELCPLSFIICASLGQIGWKNIFCEIITRCISFPPVTSSGLDCLGMGSDNDLEVSDCD